MEFQEELTQRTQEAQEILEAYLPKEEGPTAHLAKAMNYSLLAGGKRLRPVLLLASYRLFGGEERVAEPFAAAIEMIHTHSLIHDDLPALDNDDYRRGRLTTHKAFGEATAILAGDALLNYAYETMIQAFALTAHPHRVVQALCVLATKTGIRGMLGGQSVDVQNDGKALSCELLAYIYQNKTSALLQAPLVAGAILAGADDAAVRDMEEAGEALGLAFQLQDDILDVTSTQEELGKPVNSDERNHKTTAVTLWGLKKAREEVRRYSGKAEERFGRYPESDFLCCLTGSLIQRKK